MRIAVSTNDEQGLEGLVSGHFGRCSNYALIDVENGRIGNVNVVGNPFFRNHGGLGDVPDFIRSQGADVIVAGGMGPKAIEFFNQFGIKVVTGVNGKIKDVVNSYLSGESSGNQPCTGGHSSC